MMVSTFGIYISVELFYIPPARDFACLFLTPSNIGKRGSPLFVLFLIETHPIPTAVAAPPSPA
jgi:hypothetical protein